MVGDEQGQVLHGVCLYYDAQGGGMAAAFQDSRFPNSFEGLHILKCGDQLTIFDPNEPQRVVWSGIISFHLEGIHARQRDVDKKIWGRYFFGGYSAELILACPPEVEKAKQ